MDQSKDITPSDNSTSLLALAKAYIDAGFQCHPCFSPNFKDKKRAGKAPKISDWSNKKLSFDEFLSVYSLGDNLGVVMGESSQIVCIDIDPKNGGLDWYKAHESELGEPIVEVTGSGGLHLYYPHPQIPIASRISFSPGVDVLADGGRQVVTSPSIHASGKPYHFKEGFFTLLDVATEASPLPQWILKALTPMASTNGSQGVIYEAPKSDPSLEDLKRAREALERFPEAIEGQGGDTQTLKAAGLMRSYGLTPKTALKFLVEFYNPRCIPMWEYVDLQHKVLNAYKYADRPAGEFLAQNQFKVEEQESKPPKLQEASGVKSLSLVDFLATPFAKKEHYLGPFVKQGVSLVYAATGVGKTHFCIGVAFAIASGGDFLRWKCEEKAKVLYIDGELPGHYLKSMLKPLYDTSHEKDIHFDIITPDAQKDALLPNLATSEGQKAVAPMIEKADVIFVDNLSTLVRSGKENEAEYWAPIQSWFLSLRRMGKSVIFVHHAGKGAEGSFRGTSKITDAVDLAVALKTPSGHKAEDGCVFDVSFPKYRHYRKGDATEFQARYINTEFGPPSWEWTELNEVNSNKVLEMHTSGMKPKEIANELGVSLKTAYKYLKEAGIDIKEKSASGKRARKDLDDNF